MIEGASAAPNDKKMQQQSEEHFHPSPSFSTYSSETLAEIAARVINELRFDPQNDNDNDDDPLFQPWEEEEEEENDFTITNQNDDRHNRNDSYSVNDDEDDFSFAFVSRDASTPPVSADDIFYNGQIRPTHMYPLFNNNNNNNNDNAPLNDAVYSGSVINVPNNSSRNEPTRRRLPLRKLMLEEREETATSCSSSEADESVDLEGVPEGTYCVWNPNAAVVMDRKKSKSAGSSNSNSKRWKLRELLLRSLSEGGNKGKKNTSSNDADDIHNDKKQGFVFGVPGKRTSKVAAAAKTGSGDGYGGAAVAAEREGRKKSVLPYSRPQELVGIFANVNGLGRNLHPF